MMEDKPGPTADGSSPRQSRGWNVSRTTFQWVLFITVMGALLRFYQIGHSALSNDEALQLNGVLEPTIRDLVHYASVDTGRPPLTFLVHRFWLMCVPALSTDAMTTYLRVFEAFYGIAAVAFTYWAFWPLLKRRVALIATALASTSYILIWYSREFRGYIGFYLLALLAFGFFARIMRSRGRNPPLLPLIGFTVTCILGGQIHFNTGLAWPVFGLLFFAWEGLRRKAGDRSLPLVRWRYLAGLAIMGVIAILTILPIVGLFQNAMGMYEDHASKPPRPNVFRLMTVLSHFGLGTGWQGWLWWLLVILGAVRSWRTNRLGFVVSATWIVAPVLIYVYLIGMKTFFVDGLHKYAIFMNLGFLPWTAFGVDQLAAWLRSRVRRSPLCLGLLCVALLTATATPIYLHYYRMTAPSGFVYKDIRSRLTDYKAGNLLLENYWETQFLRYYVPPAFTMATPPVFRTPDEFRTFGARQFLMKVIEQDPLMIHFDSGSAVSLDENKDYTWRDHLFIHKHEFVNREGDYLLQKGLNFFAGVPDDANHVFSPVLYANAPADLPAYCARRNRTRVTGFGPGWFHLTAEAHPGDWRHYYVTDSVGVIYVCTLDALPARVRIVVDVQACADDQRVHMSKNGQAVSPSIRLNPIPMTGFLPETQEYFRKHIPLGRILREKRMLPDLPFHLLPTFEKTVFEVTLTERVTPLFLTCSDSAGIIVARVVCE